MIAKRELSEITAYNNITGSDKFRRVLFICKANASRSIMAEVIFNKLAQNAVFQASNIYSRSAGIDISWEGEPANDVAQKVMEEIGLDISNRRCKYIDQSLVNWADIILTMEEVQKYYLKGLFPESAHKVMLISEFVGNEGEVPDPYQHGVESYRICRRQLTGFINIMLDKMKPARLAGKCSYIVEPKHLFS